MADGSHLGRYEILGMLGRGGFATVYRARDPMLDRVVAIKTLLPHLAEDPAVRARFLAEARAIARLRHPHIVTIFEAGEAEGQPYYAMELVEGGTLADLLARQPRLAPAQVAAIVRDLATAIDYLHAAGLVHRDIKPANIMLGTDGRVVLMDFGVARILDQTQFTRTGATIGTPEYMAPEQALGEQAGPAADIYALGVIAFHLLAGQPPFSGPTVRVLHAQAYDPPPPLHDLCPGLPPLYAAIDAALAKEPAKRPGSARVLASALSIPEATPPIAPAVRITTSTPRRLTLIGSQPAPVPQGTPVPPRSRPTSPMPTPRARRGSAVLLAVGGAVAVGLVVAIVLAAAAGGHRSGNNNSNHSYSVAGPRSFDVSIASSVSDTTPPTTTAVSGTTNIASPSPSRGAAAAGAKPLDLAADDQQKLTLNLSAEPQYLDPQISNFQQDIGIEHLLWRGLFYFDLKTNTVPALAAAMPTQDNGGISADGLTYNIKMKTGQKFSDGNPLTAKDMEYSIKRMLDPKLGGNYASFFYDIVGGEAYNTALGTKAKPLTPSDADLQKLQDAIAVKAVDDTTVQFKLTQPSGSFTTRLALWAAYPMEKAAIDKLNGQPMDAGNLIGNGPFILKEHAPKDHITLVPNPNYTLGAQPFLKQVIYKDIEDTTQAVNAFNNGDLDATPLPTPLFQAVSAYTATKDAIKREPQPGSTGLEYNDAQKPFDNAKVRVAFSKAIDRTALLSVVYSGTGVAGSTWLPPGLPGYDKANEDILKFDVAAAKQSLADAGFPNGQGLPPIKILLSDTPTNKLIFDFVSKQLKDNLNVTLQSDLVDSKTRSSRLNSKDFQLSYGGWIQDYPNADDWLPIRTTTDTNNQFNYSNPAFDAAVKSALAVADPAKQAPLWTAAEKILLQDGQEGVLLHPELITLWKSKVKGLTMSLQDSILYGDELLDTAYVGK